MQYIIGRIPRPGFPVMDYLSKWDDEWGTACRGITSHAMKFESLEGAEQARERANSECVGYDHTRNVLVPASCKFIVLSLDEGRVWRA